MNSPASARPLRIAQVAPLWARVPPATYGGIELRLHWLTEELVARGHDVTLFASGDSETSAKLRAVCASNLIDAMARGEAYQYEGYANANLVEAVRRCNDFDIIHCHVGCTHIPMSVLSQVPLVHTIPTTLAVDEYWVLNRYPEVPVVAISRAQIAAVPEPRRQSIRVIHHGCDIDAYDFEPFPENYLAFLGRMGPHKSPVDAIHVARAVGMPLVMGGEPQNSSEQQYFTERVYPLIDGKNVRYLGPVDHETKKALLKNARALIFPIQWEEPFGLVMIESMACGTPVVACNRGSVSEVIDFGTTGFYTDSVDGLASLVPPALALDRAAVRARVRERFSRQRMTDEYVALYRSLLSAGRE